MNIADVIGWKFNHQPGMCCAEDSNGVLRITEFPGGIPSQADQEAWTAEYAAWLALPKPVACSPWQIRKALNALGLRQSVEDAVAASADLTLKDGWAYATEFKSDDPFVIAMGAALGKSEGETRDLIEYAATL